MWVSERLSRKFYLKSDSLRLSLAKPLTHRKNTKIQTNWLTCREAENNLHNGETLCLHTISFVFALLSRWALQNCICYNFEAVFNLLLALCCQQPVHWCRACRCVQTRSRPWMRAHLPKLGKAHGQVVNKWKWKIATTCWARSSTCRRERWSGHDGCPICLLLLIWSKKIYEGQPLCLHLHAPPFSTIIDKQICAGHPQAQKIACVQNCLWDEVFCLFVGLVQSCFWVQVYC